jgi:6-pyruvoyltetrahydropterin/6-carboxytetrahydropterin synthase
MLTITRKLEFDAGHRIPDHKSQCRNLHGHRYTLEITLVGAVIQAEGNSDNGMIMDFSDIKALAKEHLVDVWDHAFLVYEKDDKVRDFLASLPGHKTVVIDRIPTVENLAQVAWNILKAAYTDRFGTGLRLHKLVLHETPNCWAEIPMPDSLPRRSPMTLEARDGDGAFMALALARRARPGTRARCRSAPSSSRMAKSSPPATTSRSGATTRPRTPRSSPCAPPPKSSATTACRAASCT